MDRIQSLLKMIDLIAEIRFLSTEEGGRRSPIMSGCRPMHNFEHPAGHVNDAAHHYRDTDCAFPGETVVAELTLAVPEKNFGRLYVGMPFTVQEASRIVGRGVIKEICNPQLQRIS
jgi:translation elongation factor EF-Tu-like GTPase